MFTNPVGPVVPVPATPLELFHLFFSVEILEHISNETNRYAQQCMGIDQFATWQTVSIEELQAFMGFMILMGLVHLPALSDYWSKDAVYHYDPVCTRNRFTDFSNNELLPSPGSPGYKKLGKIEPVLQLLGEKFKTIHKHNKEVSIDEAMISFKGRSSMKQYMPLKPVK